MFKRYISAIMAACALTSPAVAQGQASYGINIKATVPVSCSVRFLPDQAAAPIGNALRLGIVREFCNSSRGYRLVVNYQPGTLRGATVLVGDDRVVLDGSGQAVITQSSGARARVRTLEVIPGQAGLDTNQLSLDILVNA